ncbi:hypothetical protein NXS19_001990 [Fusarium pseudograminearum]|nr:hypothetical protein NXS19_001990 [Fusarium pseudograminearum]
MSQHSYLVTSQYNNTNPVTVQSKRTQCSLFGPTMQVLCFLRHPMTLPLHPFDSTIQKPRTCSPPLFINYTQLNQ